MKPSLMRESKLTFKFRLSYLNSFDASTQFSRLETTPSPKTLQLKMKYSILLGAGVATALDNGRSVTPPLGWRSWNLFGAGVTQPLIVSQMAGMVDRSRGGVSLLDLGYSDVGLDDNWQECGSYGPNKYTFHSEEGRPVVNPIRFPDFQNMTNYAHSVGLTAGWVRGHACFNFAQRPRAGNSQSALLYLRSTGTTASAPTTAPRPSATRVRPFRVPRAHSRAVPDRPLPPPTPPPGDVDATLD